MLNNKLIEYELLACMARMTRQKFYYGSVFRFDLKIPTARQMSSEPRISDCEEGGRGGRKEAPTTTRTKMIKTIIKTRRHVT